MRKYIAILGILAIWGLLVWGNVSLIVWGNNTYQERMANNFLINNYDGKLLLTQTEYSEFKQHLVSPEVCIRNLEVYGSPDVLITYDITSPDSKEIPFVGSPLSQHWKYDRGRFFDYFMFGVASLASMIVGGFLFSYIVVNLKDE